MWSWVDKVADKLVSMKITAAERKDQASPMPVSPTDAPRYPYGLELHLDQDSLDKLDLTLPKVGKEFLLVAKVKVTNVSSHENVGQKTQSTLGLQITSMCLEPPGDDAASKLYPEKG